MDRYGRITFEDGANIAQGFRIANKDSIDQEAFAVADKLYKGKGNADLTGHRPEAQFKGASLYWEMGTKELDSKIKEKQLSTEGMRQQVEQFKLHQIQQTERMRVFQGLIAAGQEDAAKEVGREIFNQMPNGMHVQAKDVGKLNVTTWNGEQSELDDKSIEEYQNILCSYFNMSLEERANAFASGKQLTRQKNMEKISQAEAWVDPRTGKLAYLVPAGTWDPNGQPRGLFFVDGPTENAQEIPPDQAANFMPLKAYKQGRVGTREEQNYRLASQDPNFAAFLDRDKGGKGRGKTDFFDDRPRWSKR